MYVWRRMVVYETMGRRCYEWCQIPLIDATYCLDGQQEDCWLFS